MAWSALSILRQTPTARMQQNTIPTTILTAGLGSVMPKIVTVDVTFIVAAEIDVTAVALSVTVAVRIPKIPIAERNCSFLTPILASWCFRDCLARKNSSLACNSLPPDISAISEYERLSKHRRVRIFRYLSFRFFMESTTAFLNSSRSERDGRKPLERATFWFFADCD